MSFQTLSFYKGGVNMKKLMIILIGILLLLPGCTYAVRQDGPYTGKVIDADTGQPIEGAVILGTWYTAQFSPAGATHNFYDAAETLTDKNGEFEISGKGLRVLSNLEPMGVMIFKAGYSYDGFIWEPEKGGYVYREDIKWENGNPVIPLKKLTMEERRKRLGPPLPPTEAPKEKVIQMLREINKDSIERGLKPIEIWRGDKL
jgi:hypothetical protein